MANISIEKFKQWYQVHKADVLKDFFTFLRFPSISTDPLHNVDSRNAASWLVKQIQEIGLDAELWETPGLPVVFASYLKAGPERPTLLIYQHYDVQPVDPLPLWKSDPFEPEIRNNQIFARGALDNKGQCFYTLTALKGFFALAEEININIKVFIEGEEESGGRGTAAILDQKKGELKADYMIVSDFDLPAPGTPGITLGIRGMITFDVECSNSKIDLHSGSHGGIALNPNRALASMIDSLWDKHGKVAISGFYDDVQMLPKEQLAQIDLSFDEKEYSKSFGVSAFCPEEGFSLKESNCIRPVLEVNGMWGGYTGTGFKTVIPSKAFAKISCRLVSGQDPEKIGKGLVEHLKNQAPKGINVDVDVHHGSPAYCGSIDSSIVKTIALAYEEIFGKPCKYLLCGASVPIVADLARVSGAEVAMIGMGLADDDIHAPNEHFGLDRFELGYLSIGRVLSRLSCTQ